MQQEGGNEQELQDSAESASKKGFRPRCQPAKMQQYTRGKTAEESERHEMVETANAPLDDAACGACRRDCATRVAPRNMEGSPLV